MKKIFLILLTLVSLNIFAQSDSFKVKEGSFHKVDGCVTIPAHTDINDHPMGVIKIIPDNINEQQRMRLTFEGNLATDIEVEQHEGETWVYVTARAVTFLRIKHPDFGVTEFYPPMEIEANQCYEMTLQYLPLTLTSAPEPKQQNKYHLIVKADQADATIYIDDEPLDIGEASKLVNEGTTHTYKIECKLYHAETGSVTVNERTVIEKNLRPNFGYINVTTSPESGAKVFVDGDYIGLSPIKTDKLASGSHTVRAMKDMFKMKEQSFVVNDGQTTNATLNMSANFVSVTINTDADADIYVDEEYKGKGRWTGRISEGSHIFEARKTNHKASRKTLDLVLGENKTITLEAPKPINGSIEINSSPMEANIYIDGKSYGTTPNYINEIIIGTHELKFEKQGCTTITKTINVKEGETLTVNEKLVSQQTTDNRQQASGNAGGNETFTVNGVSFTMIKVEGGTFQMGATSEQSSYAASNEKPVHSVTLSDYYIGETEVTQELWEAVMGTTVYQQRDKANAQWNMYGTGNDYPMYYVSWEEAKEFCRRLSQKTGKNFRLPTEAEWEYAARGGNKSKGYKYSGSNAIGNVAWYGGNSGTHNVKIKLPNELGIYDMSGNVNEWCEDWYGDYSSGSQTNPTGPSSGSDRVYRGGSWNCIAGCRVSDRHSDSPDDRYSVLGLRLCLYQY